MKTWLYSLAISITMAGSLLPAIAEASPDNTQSVKADASISGVAEINRVLSVTPNQNPIPAEERELVVKWFAQFDKIRMHYTLNILVRMFSIIPKSLNPLAYISGKNQWWTSMYTHSYNKAEQELKALKPLPISADLTKAWLDYFEAAKERNLNYRSASRNSASKKKWLKEDEPLQTKALDSLAKRAILLDYELRAKYAIPFRQSTDEDNAMGAFMLYDI